MKKYIFIVIAFVTIISCSKSESELDRTIFIPDENNPNLPEYSEWGYNAFGAIYERTYFVASNNIIPCKIMYSNDSIRFFMQGVMGNDYPNKKMSLAFTFPSEVIAEYNDLIILNKKVIDLRSNCVVMMAVEDNEKKLDIIKGKLDFKRVQQLRVDDIANRVILSGTFDIQFVGAGSFPENLSDGRFDFGITEREFYYTTN